MIGIEPSRPRRRRLPLIFAIATVAALAAVAAVWLCYDPSPLAHLPRGLTADRDVSYGASPHQTLDIVFHTQDTRPRPAIVMIHEGGWYDGDKASYHGLMAAYAQLGYVTASLNFRPATVAGFPGPVDDCRQAVRWLRAHTAAYHIDPARIGIMGWSSGAHLAAMLALAGDNDGFDTPGPNQDVSGRVQAAVCWAGVYDFLLERRGAFPNSANDPVVAQFLGGSPRDKPEVARRASPVTYLTPDDPPLLVFHGEQDRRIDVEQARELAAALAALGRSDEVVLLPREGHGVDVLPSDPQARRKVREFFAAHLHPDE